MSHLLRYPTSGAPTATLTLRPSLVFIEQKQLRAVQRILETPDGTLWPFQLSATRPQRFDALVEALQQADSGGFSGFGALETFLWTTVNGAMNAFDLTHTDGTTTRVRFLPDSWQFTDRRLKGFWDGQFTMVKVV